MKQKPFDFTVFRQQEGWGVYGAALGTTILRFGTREEAEATGRALAAEHGVALWLQLTPSHLEATLLASV